MVGSPWKQLHWQFGAYLNPKPKALFDPPHNFCALSCATDWHAHGRKAPLFYAVVTGHSTLYIRLPRVTLYQKLIWSYFQEKHDLDRREVPCHY